MELRRRQFLTATTAAAGLAALPGAARAAATQAVGGAAFGSYWRALIPAGANRAAIARAVGGIVAEIDRALSPYRPGSEISRFNRSASRGWRDLGPDTATVMTEALRIAALTGGAFDPTVGPLVGRLGFGPIGGVRAGNYRDLAYTGRRVRKNHAAVTFDPCGIAKGHAVDRIARRLDALGVGSYLLELGGEVFARGRHPRGRPWRVGVERPEPGGLHFEHLLRLDGAALATSGDAAQSYRIAGRRYSHIVDPATGAAADPRVASVSVIHRRGITADGLATALAVAGPDRGLALARRLDLAALFIVRAEGGLKTAASPAFAAHIAA